MLAISWKHQVALAVPCKIIKSRKRIVGVEHTIKSKQKLACILEACDSAKLRMEELPTRHEDHIAGKGDNALQHYNLSHKLFLCLKP